MPPGAQAQDAIGIGGQVFCAVSGIPMGRKVQVCGEGRELSRMVLVTAGEQRGKGRTKGRESVAVFEPQTPGTL